jgi:uncharacterized protein YqeY
MELKQKIELSLREAMKANDVVKRNTYRMVLTAIKNAEVDKGAALDEQAILSILQKEIKSRRETIEDAKKGAREDIIQSTLAEIAVIEVFLPQQLSLDELEVLVKEAIQEVGAVSPADTGKVMKIMMSKVAGRAPGDQISQMVRKLLQS